MSSHTYIPFQDSALAASRILSVIPTGGRWAIERELDAAEEVCRGQVFGDTAEAERRELLDSIVGQLRQVVVAGDEVSGEKRELGACFRLLKHLEQAQTSQVVMLRDLRSGKHASCLC